MEVFKEKCDMLLKEPILTSGQAPLIEMTLFHSIRQFTELKVHLHQLYSPIAMQYDFKRQQIFVSNKARNKWNSLVNEDSTRGV